MTVLILCTSTLMLEISDASRCTILNSKRFQSKIIYPSMTGKELCIACVGIHMCMHLVALETEFGVSYQSNLLLLLQ